MKTIIKSIIIILFVFIYSLSVNSQSEFTMQIVLDKAIDAGELKLFPGVKDKDSYWYLPNKLRLAKNEDDTPKLSFIKWVHNEENGTDEGIGGGVLHCVFGFEITDEELEEARQALKKVNSKGEIMGSVIYKSGTVTVSVPKIADPDKEEVVAVSPAPTMEGSFVAVNLQLDKRSATLLWESFDTPNPLVIFNFNMVLAGYNSPMEAKIIIKRDQVYDSQSFQAGVATPWLSAEVGVFVENLIDKGAITIEKTGANFSMDKAIELVIQKATEEFFTPLGSSQGPNLSQIGAAANSRNNKSYLDRASTLLNNSRKDARAERTAVRNRNTAERNRVDRINRDRRVTSTRDTTRTAARDTIATGGSGELRSASDGGLRPTDEQGRDVAIQPDNQVQPNLEEEPDMPSIAIVASYVIKKVKISGEKIISFKESQPTTIPMPFGGNLGVSRKNCKSCFREVNLDDKVFKQREILALIDGLNESDFDKYINYGTAQLRKKHENDEYTYKEVRITRKNFNQEGNLFKMVYGWKGDNDRSKWFDYDYKVAWSFFGGHSVESDWQKTNRNAINLSAPLQRKIITITAERELLEEKKVRAVYVTIYYNLGGEDQIKQYAIDIKKDVLSGQVEFMLPRDKQEYDYEITWRLWGNEQIKSERKTTRFETLYVDEIPN